MQKAVKPDEYSRQEVPVSLIKTVSLKMSIQLVNKLPQRRAERLDSQQKAGMLERSISTRRVENPAGVTLHIPTAR